MCIIEHADNGHKIMSNVIIRVFLAIAVVVAAIFFIQAQRWNGLASEYERFYDASKYDDAFAVVKKQLQIAESMFFFGRYFIPFSLNNLGNIYYGKNKFPEAEECYVRAVSAAESVFGTRSQKLLPLLENLVRLYKTVDKQEEMQASIDRIELLKDRGR